MVKQTRVAEPENATLELLHWVNIDGLAQTELRCGADESLAIHPVPEPGEVRDPTLAFWIEVALSDFPTRSGKWADHKKVNEAVRHFSARSAAINKALKQFAASVPTTLNSKRDVHVRHATELDFPGNSTVEIFAYFKRARGAEPNSGARAVLGFARSMPRVLRSFEKGPQLTRHIR